MHQLNWVKCHGQVWCSLLRVDLSHAHFNGLDGVYVIWHGGPNPKTVYVGQGNIRDRLNQHRSDPRIQKYSAHGLFATWAAVDAARTSGAERYLFEQLQPLEGSRSPQAVPIAVNFPVVSPLYGRQ